MVPMRGWVRGVTGPELLDAFRTGDHFRIRLSDNHC